MSQPTDQRGAKLYLGSDLIKRTLADHVAYMRACAGAWEGRGDKAMAFAIREKVGALEKSRGRAKATRSGPSWQEPIPARIVEVRWWRSRNGIVLVREDGQTRLLDVEGYAWARAENFARFLGVRAVEIKDKAPAVIGDLIPSKED